MIHRALSAPLGFPALLLGSILIGCGKSGPSGTPALTVDPCRVPPVEGPALDTIRVAITDSVGSAGLVDPSNPAEALVGAQLYRSFLARTCDDRLTGDLAERWSFDAGRGTWEVTLRDSSIVPSLPWLDSTISRMAATGLIGAESRRNGSRRAILSVAPVDSMVRGIPGLWATVRQSGPTRPDGVPGETGRYRVESLDLGFAVLKPADGSSPPLRFEMVDPKVDLRDLIDANGTVRADLLITRDPSVIGYGKSRPEFRAVSLAWDRVYLLVGAPLGNGLERDSVTSDDFATVRGEYRPARSSFTLGVSCEVPSQPTRVERVIAYALDDPMARDLAERLVALAGWRNAPRWLPAGYRDPGAGVWLMTRGYPRPVLDSLVAAGAVLGAIVPVPRERRRRCHGLAWPVGAGVVPLIESRPVALVRRGVGPLLIDGQGTVVFLGSGE